VSREAANEVILSGVELPAHRRIYLNPNRSDRAFRGVVRGAGFLTFVILALIGTFLLLKALPAFKQTGFSFFTEKVWPPTFTTQSRFGILALLFGTVEIAVIALVLAVPVSIATALFIAEYAPPALRRPLTSLIDLLAAVPSLIYGLWGFFFLQPRMVGLSSWLNHHLGWIPIFKVDQQNFTSSPFIAGTVVALMVVPIATSVMREVFSQAPPAEKEGAMALGGTRWGMIRTVVLPFGRGGMIGGSMLGLGRALGETIAVAIIISPTFGISTHILQSGANTIAANIALKFGESSGLALSALMATGLVLFAFTLVVNMVASLIVSRSRSGRGVEI
jgi:phosphate transport system permease protein